MKLADLWSLVKEAATTFWNHKGQRLGAALAFYAALSLSPLVFVMIAIAGFVYGEAAVRGEIRASDPHFGRRRGRQGDSIGAG